MDLGLAGPRAKDHGRRGIRSKVVYPGLVISDSDAGHRFAEPVGRRRQQAGEWPGHPHQRRLRDALAMPGGEWLTTQGRKRWRDG